MNDLHFFQKIIRKSELQTELVFSGQYRKSHLKHSSYTIQGQPIVSNLRSLLNRINLIKNTKQRIRFRLVSQLLHLEWINDQGSRFSSSLLLSIQGELEYIVPLQVLHAEVQTKPFLKQLHLAELHCTRQEHFTILRSIRGAGGRSVVNGYKKSSLFFHPHSSAFSSRSGSPVHT